MPISHKHKIIFIHVPKNAGTSVTNALSMVDIGHHKWDYYVKKYPNEWSMYKKIAIIRNPWDRLVSCYEYGRMEESYWHSASGKSKRAKHPDLDLLKNISFKQCVKLLDTNSSFFKHHGWASQSIYIFDNDTLKIDYLIDYSQVEKSIQDLTGVQIQKQNSSGHKNYDLYYDDETVELVSKIYKRDIKLLNFKYEY